MIRRRAFGNILLSLEKRRGLNTSPNFTGNLDLFFQLPFHVIGRKFPDKAQLGNYFHVTSEFPLGAFTWAISRLERGFFCREPSMTEDYLLHIHFSGITHRILTLNLENGPNDSSQFRTGAFTWAISRPLESFPKAISIPIRFYSLYI